MSRLVIFTIVLLLLAIPFGMSLENKKPDYQKMLSTVLEINTDAPAKGSGAILDNGYIISAHHAIIGANEIKANFKDGKEFTLKIVKDIPEKDLVILLPLINLDKHAKAKLSCEPQNLAQDIIAIGNPTFLDFVMTFGKIAKENSVIKEISEKNQFYISNMSLAPGMSGGPVFNKHGEVIGLNDAILTAPTGTLGVDIETKKPTPTKSFTGISFIISNISICEEFSNLNK